MLFENNFVHLLSSIEITNLSQQKPCEIWFFELKRLNGLSSLRISNSEELVRVAENSPDP